MFTRLLIAQGFSLSGGYIQALVLSWYAAELAGGLYALSGYMLACYLPVAILSYPIGRFLDGRNQKSWLIGSELTLAILSLILWWAARRELVSFLFLLIFGGLWGVVRAIQTPIYQSLPRRLADRLDRGTALLTVVTYGARGLGPILGGLLYARFGAPLPILINCISFIPSVALLCTLKLPMTQKGRPPALRPRLLRLLLIFAVGFFGANYNVTFVSLVRESGMGSGAYGFALGLLGIGALLGFWLKSKNLQFSPALSVAAMGGLYLLLAFSTALPLTAACILVYGLLDFWFFSQAALSLSKEAKPKELTAVMGLYTIVTIGAMPLGALLWSFISGAIGLTFTFILIGIGLIGVAVRYFVQPI